MHPDLVQDSHHGMLAAVLVRVAGKAPWWLLVPLLPLACCRRPNPSSSYSGVPLGPLFLPVFPPDLLMHSSISRLVLCGSIPWSMPPSIYGCSSLVTDLQAMHGNQRFCRQQQKQGETKQAQKKN